MASACDDPSTLGVIDLDGPRGSIDGPGPWPVTVYAGSAGRGAQVEWQVDDGPSQSVLLIAARDDVMVGLLPDAPAGSTLRYFARLADGRIEPQAQPRSVRILARPMVAATPTPCRLAFRWPIDGLRLTRFADAAPQAGVQLTAVLETNQADGEAARLAVASDANAVDYSGQVGAGVVAFDAVLLRVGANTLVAEATAPGGEACQAEIMVTLEAP
ncbi:MAG: hypothetical protein ACI9U2_000856 [Bradymonadia bacterium]|jgi:hypothetical protein